MMLPAYVKPFVKRQTNDATDAEAICEAVADASVHPLADRGDQLDPGTPRAQGVSELLHVVADPTDKGCLRLPVPALPRFGAQLLALKEQIVQFDRELALSAGLVGKIGKLGRNALWLCRQTEV